MVADKTRPIFLARGDAKASNVASCALGRRRTPKMMRALIPPVYTAICIPAMKGASRSRKNPATNEAMIPKKKAA